MNRYALLSGGLLLATVSSIAFATWEVKPRLSLEYVSTDSTENLQVSNGAKLFEIQGNIDKLWRLGLGVTLKPINWLQLNLDYAFKIDEGDVGVEEYGWFEAFSDWTEAAFYNSNTKVDKSSQLDFNAEFALYRFDRLLLTGGFGYRVDDLKWEGAGGTYVSSSAGFRDISGIIPANSRLNAHQKHSTFYLSLGAQAYFDTFGIDGRVLYGPLSNIDSTNRYDAPGGLASHLPNQTLDQNLDDTTMLGIEIGAVYRYNRRINLSLDYTYTKYDKTSGQVVIAGSDISPVLGDTVEGTFKSHETVIALGVSYRFP